MVLGRADLTKALIVSHVFGSAGVRAVLALCCNEYFRYRRRNVLEVFVGFGLLFFLDSLRRILQS